MSEIPNFWDIGPHKPLLVEETWRKFVRAFGGKIVEEEIHGSPTFNNADFLFADVGVVAELKEVKTEFMSTEASKKGFEALIGRLVKENPDWRPSLFGGDAEYPHWFKTEFIRLARPPISRILKKANIQLKETKKHFNISSSTGVLLFVNDGFTGLAPNLVCALACDVLMHSYSSVDCFVYLNVNRYVEVHDSNEPKLLWIPTYSDRASDDLVCFIDKLGRHWFDFLEEEIGRYWTSRTETQDRTVIRNSRAIILPGERRD